MIKECVQCNAEFKRTHSRQTYCTKECYSADNKVLSSADYYEFGGAKGVWKNVLKGKYGITVEDYQQMFIDQENKCAICQRHSRGEKTLVIDHNHETGKVRGLLCYSCNSGIGLLQDNIKMLHNAIEYLERTDSE